MEQTTDNYQQTTIYASNKRSYGVLVEFYRENHMFYVRLLF